VSGAGGVEKHFAKENLMTDKMRWRYRDTNPVVAAVASGTVIEIGDLLWQDVDNAKPASALVNDGGYGTMAKEFADKFLGVAMQRSFSGDTDPIRVATTGVFEFDCNTASFELGDLIAPSVAVWGNDSFRICNQQVGKVSDFLYAICRCAKRGTGLTSVLVDIRSRVMGHSI
jgi:hypothetical protein